MALVFVESFDGYGGSTSFMTKWRQSLSLKTSNPTPRTGTYCCNGNQMKRTITVGSSTIILGAAVYWTTGSQEYIKFLESMDGTTQFTLYMNADATVSLYRGDSSALLQASAALLVASAWNFIEMKVLCSDSGTWEVKLNGTSILSGSGDTKNASTAAMADMQFKGDGNNAFDDIFLLDGSGSYLNDFIGDCKVECITPQAGNGTNTGLTTSTGADHGALVDDFPANDDTDYNSSATAGVKDTYNFTNLSTSGSVKAVQVVARVKKTDSATKTFAIVARENSTDSDGTTQTAATGYGEFTQIWEKRPSDNAAWTVSDVNGGEFGLKVVA